MTFRVRQAAVLGAGVMGAQIAAHLVNCGVPVVLFDLAAKDGDKDSIVRKAIENLKKLKPAPLGIPEDASRIEAANYDEHLERLAGCDLVIEAIAERMDWKRDLYAKVAPHVAPRAIVASNTSGLSITALSEALPEALRSRFCGIHFFNPPRYMQLVELIATPSTEPVVLDDLEAFVTSALGKSVVRAKDTPNFVANRVGIAGMLATMQEAETHGLTYDTVDDLTGKKLGRASSGTFRTADVVGLDTMAHVVRTLQTTLESDPFFPSYATPPALQKLLDAGALGQKTGAGFYKKVGKDILRFDAATGGYVPGGGKAEAIVERMLKKPPAERLKLLHDSTNPQARFLWAILRDAFHYAAVHLGDIAESARDIDQAMRWGFGTREGPFELWQQAGWKQVATWVQEDIDAGRALSRAPLPAWVFEGPVAEKGGVHQADGSWSPSAGAFVPARTLPVYGRQAFREGVVGSGAALPLQSGTEVFRNDETRLWTADGAPDVLICGIDCKLHLISPSVLEGLLEGVKRAEAGFAGLVIWSPDDVFSAGANLEALMPVFMKSGAKGIAPEIRKMQDAMLAIRYAQVPVVAAMRGLALGGGCEIAVHCARRVAHMETYVGLVEVGVGLIPGGGGLTYIARRAAEMAAAGNAGADVFAFLKDGFTSAATAKVATSAIEARRSGWLVEGDVIVPHRDELLHVATVQARAMAESGWRPPARARFPAGRPRRPRDHQGTARRHARRGLHQRPRLPHRHLDRRGRHRRRHRRRLARQRGVPDDARARSLRLPPRPPQDPGTHHGHAADRQAGAQLKGATTMASKQIQDAYIVAATRTPIGKAGRGVFRSTRPDDLLVAAIRGALAQVPGLDPAAIEDAIIGCAMPEGEQGLNVGRIAALLAGLPPSCGGVTVNRFCASGLSAVQMAADRIRVGEAEVMIAGGCESMSMVPMSGNKPSFNPAVFARDENVGIAYGMGLTAEKVALQWKVSREAQDAFAVESHRRALAAIAAGEFGDETTPVEVTFRAPDLATGGVQTTRRTVSADEGPRADTSLEGLAKLRPVFAAGKDPAGKATGMGSVTAGNSSQTSDGAGALILASEAA
jgi:3-hydroxyacyl-CoA dehydrogenase